MSTFSNISSETIGPIKAKFHMEPPWDGGTKVTLQTVLVTTGPIKAKYGGTKVYPNGLDHITKVAAMPIYGKTLNNLFLWNQKADDLETWYAASGAPVLPSLFK